LGIAQALVDASGVKRRTPRRPPKRPQRIVADKVYNSRAFRQFLRRRGIRSTLIAQACRCGNPYGTPWTTFVGDRAKQGAGIGAALAPLAVFAPHITASLMVLALDFMR